MKAKDKAKELVAKFLNDELSNHINYSLAKECALITVDEILACYNWPSRELAYWQDVKTEISNL